MAWLVCRSDALGVRPVVGCCRLHKLGMRGSFWRIVLTTTGRTPRASDPRATDNGFEMDYSSVTYV